MFSGRLLMAASIFLCFSTTLAGSLMYVALMCEFIVVLIWGTMSCTLMMLYLVRAPANVIDEGAGG